MREIGPLDLAKFTLEISLLAHRHLRRGSRYIFPVLYSVLSGALMLGFVSSSAAAEPAAAPVSSVAADDTASEPTDEELTTARMHFANGVDLISGASPNYQDAFRQFQLAHTLTHGSWKVKGNLGLCALKLERDGEALAFYQGYLEEGGTEIDPDERQYIEREMLLIKGNIANIALTSSSPATRYSVSRQGSSVPPQIYEATADETKLGLRAGTLTIVASDDQGRSLSFETTVSAGELAQHHFDFDQKVETTPVPVQQTPTETRAEPMSGLRIAGIATAGVGVAALAGGVVLGILSQSQKKDAEETCIGKVCPEDTEADFDAAKTKATIANVLFISGGVLAATGVTLVIVGGKTKNSAETATLPRGSHKQFSLQLTPLAQPGGGGLLAWGKF